MSTVLISDIVEYVVSGQADVIVHGCNCMATQGAGVAKVLSQAFPQLLQADQASAAGDIKKLGTYTRATVQVGEKTVTLVNAYTQYGYGRDTVHLDYGALAQVFGRIAHDFDGQHIAFPMIGCGLAGGDWGVAYPIIQAKLVGQRYSLLQRPQDQAALNKRLAEPINIFSGAHGLGGALTNMSELARKKGNIKHSYPVRVNATLFEDAEQAYQTLKRKDRHTSAPAYNDGLMTDLICLKFIQHSKLANLVRERGGALWLASCSHFTQARSESFQTWEGQGLESRFIRNLVRGYAKSVAGFDTQTRVVHVRHAPFDVYVGRTMPGTALIDIGFGNPLPISAQADRNHVVERFAQHLDTDSSLRKRAVSELWGRTLGCWCKHPDRYGTACHADVLASVAHGVEWEPAPQELPAQRSLF